MTLVLHTNEAMCKIIMPIMASERAKSSPTMRDDVLT